MRSRSLSPTLLASSLAVVASGLLVAVGVPGTLGSASAVSLPSVSRISPVSAPAGTSIPIVIHGHGFSTTAGSTAVTFGGDPALSVTCPSPSKCTAVTPNLAVGSVAVGVTVDGTALNSVNLTVDAYAAPTVRLLPNAKGHIIFNVNHVTDHYPAQGAPGFVALTVDNTTSSDQTLTGTAIGSGSLDVPADTSQTISMVAGGGPYIATTTDVPADSLTIKA